MYAWTVPGGTGAGITIYDLENGWLYSHEDLTKISSGMLLMNLGDTITTVTTANEHHGTEVLGEMIADNNGFGVTGIAYGANIKLVPTSTKDQSGLDTLNRPNAILLAVADGISGDVILLEQQMSVCGQSAYGPIEDELAVFQAIQYATALGFVVVEAAGNGDGSTGVNLDDNSDTDQNTTNCNYHFDRNTRDSGAILVGAGRPPASGYDRQREYSSVSPLWGSSYGSRVDVQAWGSRVVTSGVGYLYHGVTKNYYYTDRFSGTSSASAMVAASAAILQAIAIQRNGAPLSPWQIRDLLVTTGSPQLGDTTQHIGPRPDLRQAIENLPQSAETLTVNVGGSQNDHICGVTNCSLSEAIEAANGNDNASIIELSPGATYTLSAVDNTDPTYGANGLPVITSPIILNANGATIERSTGAPAFRLFQVASSGTLTLRQSTLRNGLVTGQPGGALLNLGIVSIESSTLTESSAVNGGALSNQGTLNLVSSTLYNNTATGSGGAIRDSGTLTITSSTLAGNSAPTGANISTSVTTVIVKDSLLVKGTGGLSCSGTLAIGSIANMADDSSCGTSATVKTVAEINLGSLASNGGPTQTLALGSGSAAIDVGNATACKASKVKDADQRNYRRFADGNGDGVSACDIGAYEYNSTALVPNPGVDADSPLVFVDQAPSSPDGSNGWYKSPVTLLPQALDDSDVIELRCALDPVIAPAAYDDLPEELCPFLGSASVSADGVHNLYAAAMDIYNNKSEVISSSFQIDVTAPVLTCPAAGPFLLNSGDQPVGPAGVDASVSGLDEALSTLSGIVTTEAIGTQTLTFTAFDLAGNQSSQDCSYNVIYDFGGFYPPVEAAPFLNPATPGSALPLKFSLAGDQGLDILAEGFPSMQQVSCDTLEPIGDPSAAKPAGNSGLSYDPLTDWYNYIWKTGKDWAGTCQALTIQLIDATQHIAYFKFQ